MLIQLGVTTSTHLVHHFNVVPQLVVVVLQQVAQLAQRGPDARVAVVQLGTKVVPELTDQLAEAPEGIRL